MAPNIIAGGYGRGGGGSSALGSLLTTVTDGSTRSISGTTFAVFPSVPTIGPLTLAVGDKVHLWVSCQILQSGASGATTGTAGFIVDRPTSADLDILRQRTHSSSPDGISIVDAVYTVTEAGAHTFKFAGKSGNAGSIDLYGANIQTQFSALVLAV